MQPYMQTLLEMHATGRVLSDDLLGGGGNYGFLAKIYARRL
jgi:hypothetical protein